MKKILIISLAVIGFFLFVPTSHASYSFFRTITVTSTATVASGTQANFPFLVSSTDATFKSAANGGKFQSGSGFDHVFATSSANCTPSAKLPNETERYVSSTGELVDWVQVPTMATATVIYICYGDATVSVSQASSTQVWDSNYKAVYHLPDGTTLGLNDSTANGNTLSNNGTVPATTGKVDGGATIAPGKYLSHTDNASLSGNASMTIEAWYNPSAFDDFRMIIAKGDGSNRDYDVDTEQTSGKVRFFFTQGSGGFKGFTANTALTIGSWYHVVATYDGTTQRVYINGQPDGTNVPSATVDDTTLDFAIGALSGGNNGNGTADEARYSQTTRSADWILTEYNNQSSPSTFYTLGAEQPVGGIVVATTTKWTVRSPLTIRSALTIR